MSATSALDRAVDAFNDHDLDTYMELYADDVKLHGYPPPVTGRAELRAFYATFLSAFRDLALSVHEVVVDGDVLAGRFSIAGTHSGDFMGIAATGAQIDVAGMTFMHFSDDDQVVERWNQLDDVGLLTQIGVMPAPPA
jgi:steroid delta-isomerase-like uncharacterized protein